MLSQFQLRYKLLGNRWGSGRAAGGLVRSAVVDRRVVVKATKVPAKGQTEDLEALVQMEAPMQLRVRRSALASRRVRLSRTAKPAPPPTVRGDDDTDDVDDESRTAATNMDNSNNHHHHKDSSDSDDEGDDEATSGSTAAALRDATATASTSGHTHLRPMSQGALLPGKTSNRQRHTALDAAGRTPQHEQEYNERRRQQHQQEEDDAEEQQQQQHGDVQPSAQAARPQGPEQQEQQLQQQQQQQQQQAHPLPPGMTSERDRDIHNELRGCEHWRDVLDVVEDEAAQLSLRTAVQALTRLNTLTRGSPAARRELIEMPAFQTLTHLLHSQVPLMNNVQLSNTLFALAQLAVQVPEDTLQAYLDASRDKVDTFFARDIATLFAAAAAIRYSPRQDTLDELGFRATGLLRAGNFDSRSACTLLHSCALLGYKNPILVQAAAQMLAAPGVMASLTPQGVANALWGLGRMGAYHPATVEAALAAFTASPLSYKPQECANLLWALTVFRHHPAGRFAVFAKSLLSRLDSLRGADLATLLYALAYFNVAPGQQVLAKVAARVGALVATASSSSPSTSPSSPAPSSPSTSSTVAATEVAARGPGGASGSGSSTGSGSGSAINAIELCNMYWGLALLGEVETPLFSQLEEAMVAVWERGEPAGEGLPDSLKRMMFQGFLASRLAESSSRRPHSIPPLVLDACKRAWTGTVIEVAESQYRRRSVDHVAALLTKLKVVHDRRRPTGDGLGIIDLALKAGPERYVALQVLEDSHFCANDNRQLLGTTVIQRQLLEKNGWEVRYLNYRDLERLAPELQFRFLADLLRAMGVRVRAPPAAAATAAVATTPQAAGVAGAGEDEEEQHEGQEERRPARGVITPLKRRRTAGR